MIKTLQRDCQHSDEIEGKLESKNNIYKLLTREERIYPENNIKKNSQEYDKIPLERVSAMIFLDIMIKIGEIEYSQSMKNTKEYLI